MDLNLPSTSSGVQHFPLNRSMNLDNENFSFLPKRPRYPQIPLSNLAQISHNADQSSLHSETSFIDSTSNQPPSPVSSSWLHPMTSSTSNYFQYSSDSAIESHSHSPSSSSSSSFSKSSSSFESQLEKSKEELQNHQEELVDRELHSGLSQVAPESENDKPSKKSGYPVTSAERDDDRVHSYVAIRILKVLIYGLVFGIVLVSTVISKSLTLLMTSMIQMRRNLTICPRMNDIRPPLDPNGSYVLAYNDADRVAWMWALLFAIITPYVLTFGRALRICFFKKFTIPSQTTTIIVFIIESLHCIGLALLLFLVLPTIDATRGALLLSSVCTVPSLLRMFITSSPEKDSSTWRTRMINVFIFGLQLVSLTLWTAWAYYESVQFYYLIPVGLFLVSFEWWENFVVSDRMASFFLLLGDASKELHRDNGRYFLSMFLSIWKMLLMFCFMLAQEWARNGTASVGTLFSAFTESFQTDSYSVVNVSLPEQPEEGNEGRHTMYTDTSLIPLYALLIHMSVNYLCYTFGKYACKICIQNFSYSLPLSLSIPVTVALLWVFDKFSYEDRCQLVTRFPLFQYIFWHFTSEARSLFFIGADFSWIFILISVLWLMATQFAVSWHIWFKTSQPLATTDQIFVNPMYNSMSIDQSFALNRRRIMLVFDGEQEKKEEEEIEITVERYRRTSQTSEQEEILQKEAAQWQQKQEDYSRDWYNICKEHGYDFDSIDPKPNPDEDDTIRIYACATMWHEDEREMLQMLKAIMRLDFDQGVRQVAKEKFGSNEKYYELEVNIFFDDAFMRKDDKSLDLDNKSINGYVQKLIDAMNKAASQVLGSMKNLIGPPSIMETPYGGQLIWHLPSNNRLIAHLKDKKLIRDRKRWSQVMYMYYLLVHRLSAREDLSDVRKRKIANNTFILALDGDIDFQPSAVHMVVDLMKKNEELGAACGRIHPVGSGLMVWYQKFEYGIGHWFQKAAEHVFGCVLCSPGCFSLFRARALLDDSVMHKYTTKSSEALHYVQYDQGEDRWLCTLLLQRGWRIEYSAASDSYTHAPEGFIEFYIQRRRWAPSTMANLIDLLGSQDQTVKCNNNISRLYIAYQAFMLFGSVLSPATIILMVVTAMETTMSTWFTLNASIVINLLLIGSYTFVCLYLESSYSGTATKEERRIAERNDAWKLKFAMALSALYALLMLAVLAGTAVEMVEKGPLSPNSLFFSAMIFSFVLAAILHPHESGSVLLFPIYMLLIPSMYLLLTIYSVTNMHIVKWGTREDQDVNDAVKAKQEQEEQAKQQAKSGFLQHLPDLSKYKPNTGGWLACLCCSVDTSKSRDPEKSGALNCMCCSGGPQQSANALDARMEALETKINEVNSWPIMKQIESHLKGLTNFSLNASARNSMSGEVLESSVNFSKRSSLSSTSEEEQSEDKSQMAKQITDNAELNSEHLDHSDCNCDPDTPKWMSAHATHKVNQFSVKKIHPREEEFWESFIEKYLKPIVPTLEEEEKMRKDLFHLRNKAAYAMGFLNILIVVLFFLLQANDSLIVRISYGAKNETATNTTVSTLATTIMTTTLGPFNTFEMATWEESSTPMPGRDEYGRKVLEMHPIGFWLVIFFGSLLLLQVTGMFIHRLTTFNHLIVHTNIFTRGNISVVNEVKKMIIKNELATRKDTMYSDLSSSPSNTLRSGKSETLNSRRLLRKQQKSRNKLGKIFDKQFELELKQLEESDNQVDDLKVTHGILNRLRADTVREPMGPEATDLESGVGPSRTQGQEKVQINIGTLRMLKDKKAIRDALPLPFRKLDLDRINMNKIHPVLKDLKSESANLEIRRRSNTAEGLGLSQIGIRIRKNSISPEGEPPSQSYLLRTKAIDSLTSRPRANTYAQQSLRED